jgi:hypothetical protein
MDIKQNRIINNQQQKKPSSGMWRRVGVLRANVVEERVASIFRVERVHELEITLAAISRLNCLLVTANVDPHSTTSQKTPFFIVTAVKTSNLT